MSAVGGPSSRELLSASLASHTLCHTVARSGPAIPNLRHGAVPQFWQGVAIIVTVRQMRRRSQEEELANFELYED